MKKLLSIFFIILFFSCSKKNENGLPRVIVSERDNVNEVNSKEMLNVSLDIEGRNLASNFINDTVIKDEFDFKKDEIFHISLKNSDTVLPRYKFKIIIDTSYTIPSKGFQYKKIKKPSQDFAIVDGKYLGEKRASSEQEEKSNKDFNKYYKDLFALEKVYVKCYPLLVFNDEEKASLISYIKLIQEAKDRDGKWKPIEFFMPTPNCFGNNIFFKSIPKRYQAISLIKYNGEFKTKLRAKVKINNYYYYSNEIIGYINESQFDKTKVTDEILFLKPNFNNDYLKEYLNYTLLKD